MQLTLLCVVYWSTVSAFRALLSFFIPNIFIFFCLIFTALCEWNKYSDDDDDDLLRLLIHDPILQILML